MSRERSGVKGISGRYAHIGDRQRPTTLSLDACEVACGSIVDVWTQRGEWCHPVEAFAVAVRRLSREGC